MGFGDGPASPGQRSYIRQLLAQAEFDTRVATFQFRRLGVPEILIGRPVDDWLSTLDSRAASQVIDKLKDIAGVEDDDED